jgi:hypothetical protein
MKPLITSALNSKFFMILLGLLGALTAFADDVKIGAASVKITPLRGATVTDIISNASKAEPC